MLIKESDAQQSPGRLAQIREKARSAREWLANKGQVLKKPFNYLSALKNEVISHIPAPIRERVAKSRKWLKDRNLRFESSVMSPALTGYFAGSDLANGRSIGEVAAENAGFWGANLAVDKLFKRFPKNKITSGLKFITGFAAGLPAASVAGNFAAKYAPIGHLAKPQMEQYGADLMKTSSAHIAENTQVRPSDARRTHYMDDTSMVKQAEVSGVLSAFVDYGYMDKMAEDEFAELVEKVAEELGDDYTVQDVAYVTDAVLNGEDLSKTAEEQIIDEMAPGLGYLCMAKMASEIDDDEFEELADAYVDAMIEE